MISVRSNGIGRLAEYPGYYCYDASRPSWLPYWLDDITESLCKWSPKTIAGNIVACATSDPTCGTPSKQAANPDLSGPGVAGPGEPANVPKCGQFETYDPQSDKCIFGVTKPSTLIVVGLAVLAVSVLRR